MKISCNRNFAPFCCVKVGATLKLFAKRLCNGGVGECGNVGCCCDCSCPAAAALAEGKPNDMEPKTPADWLPLAAVDADEEVFPILTDEEHGDGTIVEEPVAAATLLLPWWWWCPIIALNAELAEPLIKLCMCECCADWLLWDVWVLLLLLLDDDELILLFMWILILPWWWWKKLWWWCCDWCNAEVVVSVPLLVASFNANLISIKLVIPSSAERIGGK